MCLVRCELFVLCVVGVVCVVCGERCVLCVVLVRVLCLCVA